MPEYAANLRRIMARLGITIDQVVERTGLDERTIKGILSGASLKPHARTLHQLAAGLDVPVDELFQNPALLAHRLFDQQCNPAVDELIAEDPDLFRDWSLAEFDELYSRFGTGGQLTGDGVRAAVADMNLRRELLARVTLLLESGQADLLSAVIDVLYQRVAVHREGPSSAQPILPG
jgi:transcriptional regulator with XRE-family HTH domain